jgi:DNA-binding response OmpR family regulator
MASIQSAHIPIRVRRRSTREPGRRFGASAWLVMPSPATMGVLARRDVPVESVSDPTAFVRRLRDGTGRLAILAKPPAGPSDVLAALAERRRRPALCLVLVNEPADVTGRLDALALGFDEAFPATMDPRELEARIRRLLERDGVDDRARRFGQFVIAPGLEIDRLAKRVRRDGHDVHLRPREFALLDALAAEPGRVFPRTELIERVWGDRYRGSNRTVDVHIRWLRAKLEPEPARPVHVVTVRGTGYRLDVSPA